MLAVIIVEYNKEHCNITSISCSVKESLFLL
uniref:Uncharacterized protein n=1 Tax=Anguilla anguilla TaxID=7936 RepID=A0A0E9XV55_ANGAN